MVPPFWLTVYNNNNNDNNNHCCDYYYYYYHRPKTSKTTTIMLVSPGKSVSNKLAKMDITIFLMSMDAKLLKTRHQCEAAVVTAVNVVGIGSGVRRLTKKHVRTQISVGYTSATTQQHCVISWSCHTSIQVGALWPTIHYKINQLLEWINTQMNESMSVSRFVSQSISQSVF